MKKFTVIRDVIVRQAISIKAETAAKAIEASRKTKFKEWSTVDNAKRSNYNAVEAAN
jgi:hypothetical protein